MVDRDRGIHGRGKSLSSSFQLKPNLISHGNMTFCSAILEIHGTAADAGDLKGLVTDLSTSRGCRVGRRPPSRRCMRPPCRWCRPLSSASVSWSRGRRWRCSRPSRPTPTTGTRRRGTESRSPSLLCNIIITSVLYNITIRMRVCCHLLVSCVWHQ